MEKDIHTQSRQMGKWEATELGGDLPLKGRRRGVSVGDGVGALWGLADSRESSSKKGREGVLCKEAGDGWNLLPSSGRERMKYRGLDLTPRSPAHVWQPVGRKPDYDGQAEKVKALATGSSLNPDDGRCRRKLVWEKKGVIFYNEGPLSIEAKKPSKERGKQQKWYGMAWGARNQKNKLMTTLNVPSMPAPSIPKGFPKRNTHLLLNSPSPK